MEQNTDTKKAIRFVDSSCRLLFTIPNGGSVCIVKPDVTDFNHRSFLSGHALTEHLFILSCITTINARIASR